MSRREVTCRELTELVTEYLDDAVDSGTRRRIDRHLARCEGCRRVLAQWEAVIALSGRLGEDDVEAVDPTTRARLLAAFRADRA